MQSKTIDIKTIFDKIKISKKYKVKLWRNKIIYINSGWNTSSLAIKVVKGKIKYHFNYISCPYSQDILGLARTGTLEEFNKEIKSLGLYIKELNSYLQRVNKQQSKGLTKLCKVRKEKRDLQDSGKICSWGI